MNRRRSKVQAARSPVDRATARRRRRRSELRHQPFDHIYMEGCSIRRAMPRCSRRCPTAVLPRPQAPRRAFARMAPARGFGCIFIPELRAAAARESQRNVWLPIAEALCSTGAGAGVQAQVPRARSRKRFGKPVEQIGRLPDSDPAARPARLSDRHPQRRRRRKAITVQFYLPARHLATRISARSSTRATRAKAEADDANAVRSRERLCLPGVAHQELAQRRTATERDGERVSMMVTYYVADSPLAAALLEGAPHARCRLGFTRTVDCSTGTGESGAPALVSGHAHRPRRRSCRRRPLKDVLAGWLREQGHEVLDLGTNGRESVDYPRFGAMLAEALADRPSRARDRRLRLGHRHFDRRQPRTRVPLRAGSTSRCRPRSPASITTPTRIALGARLIGSDMAKACVTAFLDTDFAGGRHQRRVDQLSQLLAGNRLMATAADLDRDQQLPRARTASSPAGSSETDPAVEDGSAPSSTASRPRSS